MSEAGSSIQQAAVAKPGTTASRSSGAAPFVPPAVVGDDRTVISTRAPAAILGAGQLVPEGGRSLLGERLDHFELLDLVGGGGMGVVFKALDTSLNRIVALKVLSRDQADEEEKVRRFQNEAQSAARLDHDHIARVYFVGQDRGLHYIVFEFIEGVNLRDLVARKGPLPLEEAISYTLQVAEALAHASSRDVVHRDIKPSNVLITGQGRAKLVDMGLARLHQVEPSENDLTSSGVTLGTFDYISPEQARDPRVADVRSDIYSLGCTTFYMLTARPPFPEGNVLQKLLQHNNDPPPDPAEFNPDLPEQVSRLVRKMLAKDPRRRHQTAGELVADLLVLTEQLGLPTTNVDPLAWSIATPPRITFIERHLPWLVPLVLLIMAVAAVEMLGRSSSTVEPSTPVLASSGSTSPPPFRAAGGGPEEPASTTSNGSSKTPSPPVADASTPPEKTPATPPVASGETPPPATAADANSLDSPAALASAGLRAVPVEAAEITVADPAFAGELTAAQADAPPPAAASGEVEAGPAPAAPPVVPKLGVRIVDPSRGGQPQVYTSLREACANAVSNDVIELHFNGLIEEKPLRIINKMLTIRAGDGFRPTIAFRPRDPIASEPPAMLTVVGNQLMIKNVAIEVDIPSRHNPPSWALFQTQRANTLRLENCWLTIRNATEQHASQHPNVAFFEIKAPADSGAMAMEHLALAEQTVNIELEDCVARGEATLLRSDELQPVGLTWHNGLLATSERILVAQGSEMANRANGQVSMDLRHVTANVRNGLCMISNPEGNRPLLRTQVKCTDSIVLAGPEAALLEQVGVNSVSDFESKVEWRGNRYFYFGFSTFWRISSIATAQGMQDNAVFFFDDWQRHWGEPLDKQEAWSSVVWKRLPDSSRPFHSHTPGDYALDDTSTENQARLLGATDGTPAGLQASELPPVPITTPAQLSTSSPSANGTAPDEEQQ